MPDGAGDHDFVRAVYVDALVRICGGRSVMVVPIATAETALVKLSGRLRWLVSDG
jgi:hypothetical protein